MEPVSTPRKGSKSTARLDAAGAAVTFSPYLIRRHREELNGWLEANGLNAGVIPDHHPIRVEQEQDGTVIRYQAYVLDGDGEPQLDRASSDDALTEERTAPCTVPPPSLSPGPSAPQVEPVHEGAEPAAVSQEQEPEAS
jgi:hypothetical protein